QTRCEVSWGAGCEDIFDVVTLCSPRHGPFSNAYATGLDASVSGRGVGTLKPLLRLETERPRPQRPARIGRRSAGFTRRAGVPRGSFLRCGRIPSRRAGRSTLHAGCRIRGCHGKPLFHKVLTPGGGRG